MMVEIIFENQNLVLTVKGLHKLWALKSGLKIPFSHVKQARLNNGELSRPKGWKSSGTYIPGIISAGTFRARGEKVFWDVVHKAKTIIIDLENDSYRQIVVEVENPEKEVNRINGMIV